MAVRYSLEETFREGSVAMRRKAGPAYAVETFVTPLATVARDVKHLDAAYIRDGCDITEAFKDYVRPLVGPLPEVGSLMELVRR
jgi:6-phosphofructokinase 1